VGSTSLTARTVTGLRDHWTWRPEWTQGRTCLYWYLTFGPDDIANAVDDDLLRTVRATRWLDPVPPPWCHVTVADVGFADTLDAGDVGRVVAAARDALPAEPSLPLVLGPVQPFASAIALAAGPLDRLRAIGTRVRAATSAALGDRHPDVRRGPFRPHVSLGYVNRTVDPATARRFLEGLPEVTARLEVDALRLAAVTRRGRGYRWQVEAQVDLSG
jgi:2'-5' RNA ligase